MPIIHVCNKKVVTIDPDSTVKEAAQLMKDCCVGDLIVATGLLATELHKLSQVSHRQMNMEEKKAA